MVAVREQALTRLPPGVLAELHECVAEAERAERPGVLVAAGDPGGGVAVVLADARWSAREVQVFGLADPGAADAALTRHGFRPSSTRVTVHGGRPQADGEPVAVAFVAVRGPWREALTALAGRLVPGGVLVVDASTPEVRAAVETAFEGIDVRTVRRAHLHVVRQHGGADSVAG